jgi:microcompartment protein CcmK/EutM
MNLGKVIGTVVSTRKESSLDGLKFLMVATWTRKARKTGGFAVAADAVGAGPDEMVLVATGSSARQTLATDKRPAMPSSWPSSTTGAWTE